MKIQDFKYCNDIKTVDDLDVALSKRYLDNENWFLLCFDDVTQPSMTLAVKADLATLHYFRNNEDAGLVPVNGILDPGKEVTFRINERTEFPVRGDSILPYDRALVAAKEFFHSRELPKSVDWLELWVVS